MSLKQTTERDVSNPRREHIAAAEHLETGRGTRPASSYGTERPGEAYCTACGYRVTVGPDGTEYGHQRGCEHRPDSWPEAGQISHPGPDHRPPSRGSDQGGSA